MKPEMIMDALNNIDDAVLAEAIAIRQAKEKRLFSLAWKSFAVAACLVMAVFGAKEAGILEIHPFMENTGEYAAGNSGGEGFAKNDGLGVDCCDDEEWPGDIWPVLMVNGKLYHWAEVNLTQNQIRQKEDGTYEQDDYLPDHCRKVGEITAVTKDLPAEDFQLQAGFEARGSIYTSDGTKEVVYAVITTEWFEDTCIRFESELFQNMEPEEHNKYLRSLEFLTAGEVEEISRIEFYVNFSRPCYTVSDPEIIREIGMELAYMYEDSPDTGIVKYDYENTVDVWLVMEDGTKRRFACDEKYLYLYYDYAVEKDIYSVLMECGGF